MSDSITVNLMCFSHVKHVLKQDSMSLEIPAGGRAADVVTQVREMAGGALDDVPLRVAVNQSFTEMGTPLQDGDEVALIPPVQGG